MVRKLNGDQRFDAQVFTSSDDQLVFQADFVEGRWWILDGMSGGRLRATSLRNSSEEPNPLRSNTWGGGEMEVLVLSRQ
jgi:hypothetical protein